MNPKLMALAALLLVATSAAAEPLLPEKLFDICSAPTVAQAQVRGDRLGWPRALDADLKEWHDSFIGYNKGQVDVIGWRDRANGEGDSLSFWVAQGPNAHRACAYSASQIDGLLDGLTRFLGQPKTLDTQDLMTTAVWEHEGAEIYYAQIGATALVNIGYQR